MTSVGRESAPRPAATPEPSAFRTLLRVAIALLVTAVSLVVIWFAWNQYADRQLNSRIEAIRQAGEPVSPADRNPTAKIPDEENAAVVLQDAFQRIQTIRSTPDGARLLSIACARDYPSTLRRHVEANAVAIALTQEAMKRPRVDWGVRLSASGFPSSSHSAIPNSTYLRSVRQLSFRLELAANHYALLDEPAEALKHIEACYFLGRSVTESVNFLLAHVTRMQIDTGASRRIADLAPLLRTDGPGAPSRDDLLRMIAILLDESELRESWREAMRIERAFGVQGNMFPSSGNYSHMNLPLGKLAFSFYLDNMRKLTEVCDQDSYHDAKREYFWLIRNEGGFRSSLHFPNYILAPSYDSIGSITFEALAARRLAATALAIRLHEIDKGARPAELGELVPEYLPAILNDPFSAHGGFVYIADGEFPRLVGLDEAREESSENLAYTTLARPRETLDSQKAVHDNGEPVDDDGRQEEEQEAAGEEQPEPDAAHRDP